jgi:hypothetical protein
MTMTLTQVTTGTSFARALVETTRNDDASAALAWVARQLRFERLLRTLEEEREAAPANPSPDAV